LQAVAKAGYKQVELMDVLGAEELVAEAKDAGLEVRSGFFKWDAICRQGEAGVPETGRIVETAAKLGLRHLVFGYIGKGYRESADQYRKWAERANALGEASAKAGLQLCYHNHSFEFAALPGGGTGYDVLMKEFDAGKAKFEVDVFWVKLGGWDPLATMAKLKGRVSQVHLKDLKAGAATEHDEGKVPHDAFKELGAGTIDMAAVLKLAEELGVAECHVEQDQSPAPLDSIRQSLGHLKK
jgi:sugar phosphate isomerase/epimerase